MIIGKRDKEYVKSLKKDIRSAIIRITALEAENEFFQETIDKLKEENKVLTTKLTSNTKNEQDKLLNQLKELSGLNWTQLSRILGISTSTLNNLRNGKKQLTKELYEEFKIIVAKNTK